MGKTLRFPRLKIFFGKVVPREVLLLNQNSLQSRSQFLILIDVVPSPMFQALLGTVERIQAYKRLGPCLSVPQ